jgi:hypothetical protein
MNDQYDNTSEIDDDLDDQVDSDPADPIEETPDAEQAAEPVDNVGEVIGRRNLDLPLENNPQRRNRS